MKVVSRNQHTSPTFSKVLQIVIHHQHPKSITPEYINMILQKHGEVTKIKITNRSPSQLTALVETESPEVSMRLLHLNIPNFSMQPTTLNELVVQKTDEGIDYSNEEEQYLKDLATYFDPFKTKENTPSSRGTYLHSPETNPMESLVSTMSQLNCDESFQVLQKDLDKFILSPPHFVPQTVPLMCMHPSNILTQQDQPSTIVGLRGDFILSSARHLYNLFSNFGNIVKIYMIRILQSAIIEYESLEYAKAACSMSSGVILFNQKLQPFYSNRQSLGSLDQIKHLFTEDDIFMGSQATNRYNPFPINKRFRPYRNLTIQPPSNTIHVSNLKYQTSNADTMWDLFSNFGIVEAVKVLNTQQKFMCIVKMESMAEAVTVVACMHNYLLEGRNMQISFTSQII